MKRNIAQTVEKSKSREVKVSGKRGIVSEALPWILISIAVLAILMVAIWVMKDKGLAIIDKIKDVFKFR